MDGGKKESTQARFHRSRKRCSRQVFYPDSNFILLQRYGEDFQPKEKDREEDDCRLSITAPVRCCSIPPSSKLQNGNRLKEVTKKV